MTPIPRTSQPILMFHPKKCSSWQHHGGTAGGCSQGATLLSQACHMVNRSFQIPCSPTQLYGRETAETLLSLWLCCKTLTSNQVQRALAAGHQPVPATMQCHARPFALLWDPTLQQGKTGSLRVSWKPQQELWSIFGKHQATQRLQPSPHKPQKLSHAKTSRVPSSLHNQVYRKRTCSAPLTT